MANSYLLETLRGTIAVNKLQIVTLIESLSHSVELLTVHIEHEEERAGVRDLEDPAYPALARSLRTRRENIRGTIAALEGLLHGTPKAAQVGVASPSSTPSTGSPTRWTASADAGASSHDTMAALGHTTLAEAERYTREADRRRGGKGPVTQLNEHRKNRSPQPHPGVWGKS